MKRVKWGILCLGMCLLASLFGFIYSSRIEAYAIETENNIYSINQISEDLFGTWEINFNCSLYKYD